MTDPNTSLTTDTAARRICETSPYSSARGYNSVAR